MINIKNYWWILFTVIHITSCGKQESELFKEFHDPNNISDVIRFNSIEPINIPADSMSSTMIHFKISSNADSINRIVLLTSNMGRFINGNDSIYVNANASGNGFVELFSSSNTGITKISATVKNIRIDTTIVFETAFPEDITVSASNYILESGDVTYVKVQSYRIKGNTSNNLKVNFEVQHDNPSTVYPILPKFSVFDNNVCSIKVENPFQAEGDYYILAKVPSSQSDTLTEKIKLLFK